MVLANTLVIAGALAGYMGLERFVGKIGSQVHNYILLAAFAAVHTYFLLVHPNLEVRTLNLSLGLLIVCFQAIPQNSLWGSCRRERLPTANQALELSLGLFR
jgi:hypothetical protein